MSFRLPLCRRWVALWRVMKFAATNVRLWKINRFRAWLMDLKPQANPEPNLPFDGEPQGQTAE